MNLICKSHFVASMHMTDPPSSMTYASVVNWKKSKLHGSLLPLMAVTFLPGVLETHISMYLHLKNTYYRVCLEWGAAMKGTVYVIVRTLYGLKSSTNAWKTRSCTTLRRKLGFYDILKIFIFLVDLYVRRWKYFDKNVYLSLQICLPKGGISMNLNFDVKHSLQSYDRISCHSTRFINNNKI